MQTGLFVTFSQPGEAFDRELPPVGPLVHVVARPRQLVAERSAVHQAPGEDIPIARWLEAELELQRALGEEPGGTKRSELHVTARDGVFVRFAVFGDERERDLVPELGPFAVVAVGRRSVEADGRVLATRGASELAPWELTTAAGSALAGTHKPDIAFRPQGGAFHPAIVPLVPRPAAAAARDTSMTPPPLAPSEPAVSIEHIALVEPAVPVERAMHPEIIISPDPMPVAPAPSAAPPPTSAVDAEPVVASAPIEEPAALTSVDRALIERMALQREEDHLRALREDEERRRLGVDEGADAATTWAMRYRQQASTSEDASRAGLTARDGGLGLGDLLWRLRFALLGLVVIGLGAYGFLSFRNGGAVSLANGGGQSFDKAGIAQKVSSARWDYVVNGFQRVQTAGTSRPNGTYYVVRIGVTNRGSDGAQLSPSEFTLVDANGAEYRAEGVSSDAYYGPNNTSSQYIWPTTFAVGKTASISVIFDVSVALGRGNTLAVDDLPRTRFTLD